MVGPGVYAGVPLEPLVFNPMVEPPSVPTTKHARQLATNVPPVRPTFSCSLELLQLNVVNALCSFMHE